jgi:hypothetical protein
MTTPNAPRWRAQLSTRLLDDARRKDALFSIEKLAQQCPLSQEPSIRASLTALATKGAALTGELANLAGLLALVRISLQSRDVLRVAFDSELVTFKALVENNAQSPADITGMGLSLLEVPNMTPNAPDPPEALVVRIGRAHGKARVAVQGKGYVGHFAAEMSLDPGTPVTWTVLPGNGKERRLSGYPSGTRIWVRFASVRFGMQSAWSAPVLVIIP